ncbi:iron-containing alcohol dehydrogenase [Aureibacter tunicatorum]|nr:iron-containing alcohol dehydrogenase [Aureibacter tunicatorum]
MLSFEFKNPVKLIFGEGQIEKLKEEVPQDAKVLILYGGGSVKKNGILDQVKVALKGNYYEEFGGILANPEYSVLVEALEVIKTKNIDYLLAVGGGSVIDGVKFLSSAALFEGDNPWDILSKRIRTEKGMPFGCVLTIPATGSEMNSGAVISRSEIKEKLSMGGPGLFPQFSILDPQVIATLPLRQIQNGIADAFVHVLEQYVTYPVDAWLQDRLSESILSTLIELAPRILEDPKDAKAASNFMWSCTMALNGLIQKGVPSDWGVHMIGHELTALYGIDHARTLAIVLEPYYKHQFEQKKEKLAQLGTRVFQLSGMSEEEIARQTINKIIEFMHSIGIPTKLSEYTDDYDGVDDIIAKRFEERGWLKMGERKDIGPAQVRTILQQSY